MAIIPAIDAAEARLAILLNQALFNVGAPTAAQLEAQIDFLQTYKAIFGGNEILAVQELVRGTLAFPENADKSLAQIASDTWKGVVGAEAAPSVIAFLVTSYTPYGADAKTLLVSNIIVQYANYGPYLSGLDEFTREVAAGTADLTQKALLPPTTVLIDGGTSDSVLENSVAGTLIGNLTAPDPNSGEGHTFKLLSIDGVAATRAASEAVRIQGANLVVNNAAALDFETAPAHTLVIQATDQTGRKTEVTLTLDVLDVAEPPPPPPPAVEPPVALVGLAVDPLAAADAGSPIV